MWIYRRTSMLMTVWVLLVSTAQPATLEQVLERMRSGNPAFETAQAAVEVSKGYHRQAGLRSNPSLSVENEEMSLSRFGSLGRASTTLALSQPFDSWNKRSLNQLTTAKDVALARLETRALELELSSLVCQTFSLILVSEEREHLLKKFLEQSQRVLETVTEQVLGGERPIMEQLRVQAELHNIEVRQQQDEAEQQRLILQLAA
ncbi:MAG TPA: TolC family protein, partial [bacterium]|nr:TolC family protein [bacterium]